MINFLDVIKDASILSQNLAPNQSWRQDTMTIRQLAGYQTVKRFTVLRRVTSLFPFPWLERHRWALGALSGGVRLMFKISHIAPRGPTGKRFWNTTCVLRKSLFNLACPQAEDLPVTTSIIIGRTNNARSFHSCISRRWTLRLGKSQPSHETWRIAYQGRGNTMRWAPAKLFRQQRSGLINCDRYNQWFR